MQIEINTGNRLDVPAAVNGRHFFYKTASLAFNRADCNAVFRGVETLIAEGGLHPGQIDTFTAKDLKRVDKKAFDAWMRLVKALPASADSPRIVVCEWASPHVDESYAGTAFLSTVLHTGPVDYVLQTIHTTQGDDRVPRLHTETRVLRRGDSFVFDPTTPHCAMPKTLDGGHLLVLLQAELPDEEVADRARILSECPPLPDDGDQSDKVFSIFG